MKERPKSIFHSPRSPALLLAVLIAAVLLAGYCLPVFAGQQPTPSKGGSGHGKTYPLGNLPSSTEGFSKIPETRSNTSLAGAVDLRGQLPPIGDQGQQGSCTAWASSYYYKTWQEKLSHPSWNINSTSYQFSPSFVYNQINGGQDNGSSYSSAFSLLQNTGDIFLSSMPYNQYDYTTQPTAAQKSAAAAYKIKNDWGYYWARWGESFPYGTPNSLTGIKSRLASGQLVSISIPICADFPDYGGNGNSYYYDYDEYSGCYGWHAVIIVGYDDNVVSGADADHKGGFSMLNSWGSTWNVDGQLWLSYDFMKTCCREAWTMNDAQGVPSITSLTPTYGNAGVTYVTINGSDFGSTRGTSSVWFGGSKATTYSSWSNTQIKVRVGAGAQGQAHVKVATPYGYSNAKAFDVRPVVSSITPTSGPTNTSLTVSGSAFCNVQGTGKVCFRKADGSYVYPTTYTSWKQTQIKCVVPGSVPAGVVKVYVYTPGGLSGCKEFRKT